MGKFVYGSHVVVEFEDRVLAHLQMVIGAKLRRHECMLFSWRESMDSGEGRTTVWIHPDADLVFKYYGGRPPAINSQWIDVLMLEANKPSGLQIVQEPQTAGAMPEAHSSTLGASALRTVAVSTTTLTRV